MSTLDLVKSEIVEALAALLPPDAKAQESDLTKPPQAEMGDLSFPCFAAAKSMKKAPTAVATELVAGFQSTPLVASAKVAGPYVNFRLNQEPFAEKLLHEAASSGFGQSNVSSDHVLIEYISPNTHKELHVGHLRNLALGLA
ncbi:MAG: arginine--tRNA ligase, partial [Patescibacteria group bacterium]|nr:arginine--tRNA ligase [Patescibacteria group bacterium]